MLLTGDFIYVDYHKALKEVLLCHETENKGTITEKNGR